MSNRGRYRGGNQGEGHRGGGGQQRGGARGGRGGRGGQGRGGGSQMSSSGSHQGQQGVSGNYNGEYVAENAALVSTFVDTHCHVEYVLQRCKLGSFEEFISRNKMPHNFEGSFGCHPHNAKYYDEKMASRIEECLKHEKAIAWGECGLDFVKNESPKDKQIAAFIDQCIRAVKLNKPLVVHSRAAEIETYQIMKENLPKEWRVHVHCFGDSAAQAKRLIEEFPNVFLGFTGSITFENANELRATIRDAVPLERILLETDAPYMTPHPYKGTCHPGHVPVIAAEIAKLKAVSLDDALRQIRANTKAMYGI